MANQTVGHGKQTNCLGIYKNLDKPDSYILIEIDDIGQEQIPFSMTQNNVENRFFLFTHAFKIFIDPENDPAVAPVTTISV